MRKISNSPVPEDKPWESPPKGTRTAFFVITSLYWITLYLYVPVMSPYAEYKGGTLEMVGLVVSAYGFAQLLLRMPLGMWSDRLGRRKPFLVLGFVASVVSSIGFILSPDPWWMVVARFMAGISACAWVAFTVLFASYFSPQDTTRAMSYISFCTRLSVMGSTYVGGLLAEQYGWLAPFWASVGVGVLGVLGVAWVYEQPRVRVPLQPPLDRIRSVVRYRELVFASLVSALGQYNTFATLFGFVPTYAVGLGANKAQLGTMSLLSMLANAVATLLAGMVVAPRLGARRTVMLSYLMMAGATAVLPWIQDMGLLYVTQTVSGFGRGMATPILMGLAIARLPDSEKATAMGFYQAVYAIGMFSGPVAAGWIGEQWGYGVLFGSTAVVTVVTAMVALWLPGRGNAEGR